MGLALVAALALVPRSAARAESALVAESISTSNVHWTWDPATVVGTSKLVRTDSGISASFHGSGLTPGQAVTLWFVVFNNPEFCAASPCGPADFGNPDVKFDALYGGGHVVGGSGIANFGAHLPVGDTSGSVFTEMNPPGPTVGLIDPFGAEVHLMAHSHGPARTGQVLKTQISSFFGGCEVFLGPNGGIADGPEDVPSSVGECSTIQVSVHK
jgi:hypothetical protein